MHLPPEQTNHVKFAQFYLLQMAAAQNNCFSQAAHIK